MYLDTGKVEEGIKVLDASYKLALDRILDKEGNFPNILEWSRLENRHIIRTILRKGLMLWHSGDTTTALLVFRQLFQSNPYDNVGIRYYVLAILEGLSFDIYKSRFEDGNYLSNDIFKWFEKGRQKYLDEFKVLKKIE